MPIKNRLAETHAEITSWRHHLHAYPELGFDVHETAAFVTERLRGMGLTILLTVLAQTGVVAVIKGCTDTKGRVVGLRADMDALPILEASGVDYASKCRAKCMLVDTMGTPRCCSVRHNTYQKIGILMELLFLFFNQQRKGAAVVVRW